eukprot:scaffold7732_cov122-Isochrysis_galbana.AAC.3
MDAGVQHCCAKYYGWRVDSPWPRQRCWMRGGCYFEAWERLTLSDTLSLCRLPCSVLPCCPLSASCKLFLSLLRLRLRGGGGGEGKKGSTVYINKMYTCTWG